MKKKNTFVMKNKTKQKLQQICGNRNRNTPVNQTKIATSLYAKLKTQHLCIQS